MVQQTQPAPAPAPARRATYETAVPRDALMIACLREGIGRAIRAELPRPGARALDVGCGSQPFRRSLEEVGYHYVGLDVEQNEDGSVEFLAPIDGALPPALADGPGFDLVLCTEVLEHVVDWKTAFCNLAALLAPGGMLVITCPFFYPLHEQPVDYWRPTLYTLQHFGRVTGLSLASATRAGDGWDVLATLLGHTSLVAASRRLPDRVLARVARYLKSAVFDLISSRVLKPHLGLVGDVYLSNIVVFKKPAWTEAQF